MEGPSSRLTVLAAIAANVAIAVTKFVVAAITGSSAVLAEGIHSAVDTGDGLLLLVGERLSKRPADEAHPFGYGKELYFWTLIVGILIFAVGGGMSAFEGIQHLRHPRPLEHWWVNLIVIGAAIVFEGASFLLAGRRFREERRRLPDAESVLETIRVSKDPTTFAVLLEDGAALVGLVLAGLGVTLTHLTGSPAYDGAASIVIGVLLAAVAVLLAYESRELLIGESALRRVVRSIRGIAEGTTGLRGVRRVLTMQLGPSQILVALDAAFAPELDREALDRAARGLEEAIMARHPSVKHVFVDLHALRRD